MCDLWCVWCCLLWQCFVQIRPIVVDEHLQRLACGNDVLVVQHNDAERGAREFTNIAVAVVELEEMCGVRTPSACALIYLCSSNLSSTYSMLTLLISATTTRFQFFILPPLANPYAPGLIQLISRHNLFKLWQCQEHATETSAHNRSCALLVAFLCWFEGSPTNKSGHNKRISGTVQGGLDFATRRCCDSL